MTCAVCMIWFLRLPVDVCDITDVRCLSSLLSLTTAHPVLITKRSHKTLYIIMSVVSVPHLPSHHCHLHSQSSSLTFFCPSSSFPAFSYPQLILSSTSFYFRNYLPSGPHLILISIAYNLIVTLNPTITLIPWHRPRRFLNYIFKEC